MKSPRISLLGDNHQDKAAGVLLKAPGPKRLVQISRLALNYLLGIVNQALIWEEVLKKMSCPNS